MIKRQILIICLPTSKTLITQATYLNEMSGSLVKSFFLVEVCKAL